MTGLDEFINKVSEFEFYGVTVQDVAFEVKSCVEEIVNAALDDGERKLISKLKITPKDEFKIVKKNYMGAIRNHKDGMEAIIKDAFRLPAHTSNCNKVDVDLSNLDKEIKDLQLRSVALDVYMKELLRSHSELQAFLNTDTSESQDKFEELEVYFSQLSDNFSLGVEVFNQGGQLHHLENSVRNMTID